jgi:hypothetical protein
VPGSGTEAETGKLKRKDEREMIIQCAACEHDMDTEEDEVYTLEEYTETKLCGLCFQLNNLASEYGYDDVRRATTMLEELGSKQSEIYGVTELA